MTKRDLVLEYIRGQYKLNPKFEVVTTYLNDYFKFDTSTIIANFLSREIIKFKCGCRTGTKKGNIYIVYSENNLFYPNKTPRRVKKVVSVVPIVTNKWLLI